MKKLAIIAAVLMFVGTLCPQIAFAYDDLDGVIADTAYFDGGNGSTLNEPVQNTSSSVPDIGPSGPVGYVDQNGDYHSY